MAKNSKDKRFSLPKWFYLVIGIILALVLFFYLLTTGWVTYSIKYVRCGLQQPIYAYSTLGLAGSEAERLYALPNDKGYRVATEIGRVFSDHNYYCTETEALEAGYKYQATRN